MPGISVFCSDEPISEKFTKNINEANRLLSSYKDYKGSLLFKTDRIIAHFAAYEEYPRFIIKDERYLIFIEGMIYARSIEDLSHELFTLAASIFKNSGDEIEKSIRQWILSVHGDFILVFFDRYSQNLVVANDALGRLPLFYFCDDKKLLIAREPKFIVKALNHKRLDSVGVAEFLIFTYNLKHRTIMKNVYKLQPSSVISYNFATKEKAIKTLYNWEFTKSPDSSTNIKRLADEMSSLFMKSINDTTTSMSDYRTVLALSGGLDSRAVYFGMKKAMANFSSYSSLNESKNNMSDIKVAKQIADALPSDWRFYELNPANLDDYKAVAYNQENGSFILMALACDGYRKIKKDFPGPVALYTGDGGNQIMSPMIIVRRPKSVDSLVDFTCKSINIFKIKEICDLMQISSSDIYDSLYEVFSSYPEKDLSMKYAHFRTFARGFHLVMENEDRTRFYYWLVAPFWTVPLLRISMNVPEKYKRNLLLYKEFLRALDTRSLDFVYANTGFKLNSLSSKLYGNIKGIARSQKWLYHHTRKLVLKDNYRKVKYPFLDDYIEKIMQSSELIKEAFDIKLLNNMLDKDINKLQYFLLYTLLFRCSLIENDYNYI